MSSDRQSVPVSLPPGLVDRLDGLVEDGRGRRRSGTALDSSCEAHLERLHERADGEARADVEERLGRKRVS